MGERPNDVSILAGNSRVCLDENRHVVVEAQLKAFEAALKFADDLRADGHGSPRLSVAFDHRGIFRLQFLAEGLSNSQRRNPRMCHLHASIQAIFAPIAAQYSVPLADIRVIHEDSARQHLVHSMANLAIPEPVRRRMLLTAPDAASPKLSCAAITKEYFERAAGAEGDGDAVLEVFFEDSEWSRSLAYVRGLQLSHMLGVSADIRLNLVENDGQVSRGELIAAPAVSAG